MSGEFEVHLESAYPALFGTNEIVFLEISAYCVDCVAIKYRL